MIYGYLTMNNSEYFFSFENYILELMPTRYSETISLDSFKDFVNAVNGNDDDNSYDEDVIKGKTINNGNSILFFIKSMIRRTPTTYTFNTYAYIEFESDETEIDKFTVYSEELNWFYNIRKAYQYSVTPVTGEANVEIKSFGELSKSFSFSFENKDVQASINITRNISNMSRNPITLDTELTFYFDSTKDYEFVIRLQYIVLSFLRYIAYRKNISFYKIILGKKKENSDLYTKTGMLNIYDEKDTYIESEKTIRDKVIDFELLQNNLGEIFQAFSDGSVYLDHIPYNSRDKNKISPARFILVMAAFEWEFRNIYGDIKTKENEKFRNAKNGIIGFLEEKINGSSGKEKEYTKKYKKIIENSDMSLSERINRALKDYADILEVFITSLYKMNNIENYKYSEIALRLETQRNNYAHGNIDKELNGLVILDLIIMEWLNYAMVLNKIGMDRNIIKKSINKLFSRNFYLK
jgi:hypothetical protein